MRYIGIFAVLLTLVFSVNAQTATEKTISESKRLLLTELVNLTQEGVDYKKEFAKGIEDQKRIMASFDLKLPESKIGLSIEEQKKIKAETEAEVNLLFEQVIERVNKEVDFTSVISKALFEIYDQQFSEEDIKELIIFYRSPIGRKLTKVTPIIDEGLLKSVEKNILPKIAEITSEIMDKWLKERMEKLEKELESLEEPQSDIDIDSK